MSFTAPVVERESAVTEPILRAVTPAPPGITISFAEVKRPKSISPVYLVIVKSPVTVLNTSFPVSPSAN